MQEKAEYTVVDAPSFLPNDERQPLKQKQQQQQQQQRPTSRPSSPTKQSGRPEAQDYSSLFLAATDKSKRSTRPPRRGSLEKDATEAFLSATANRIPKKAEPVVAQDAAVPAFTLETFLSFFSISLLRASAVVEEPDKSERDCTSVFLSTIDRGNGRKAAEREHDNTSDFLSSIDRLCSRHRDTAERTCIKI